MKKPTAEKFIEVLTATGGNISRAAKVLGTSRTTVYEWINRDKDFADAVNDSRGQLLDECIVVSRLVALGIPEKDKDGKIIGWLRPPDPSMLRYLMSTLGRFEGFGEHLEVSGKATLKGNVPIRSWIADRIQDNKIEVEIIDSRDKVDDGLIN